MNPLTTAELQKLVPLITCCIENPLIVEQQTVYKADALKVVVTWMQIEQERSYFWDPAASYKEYEVAKDILQALGQPDKTSLNVDHILCYLKLNKL
jgi:hypothetical protein